MGTLRESKKNEYCLRRNQVTELGKYGWTNTGENKYMTKQGLEQLEKLMKGDNLKTRIPVWTDSGERGMKDTHKEILG